MTHDWLYLELYGADDDLTPNTTGRPAESPLDDPAFEFQCSTGASARVASQLVAEELAAELIGPEVFSKLSQGLFEAETAVRPPISPSTFVAEMPDLPLPLSDEGIREPQNVQLCDCKCERCEKFGDCKNCCAEEKCAGHSSRSADPHKATIARICGEAKGRLHAYAGSDRAAWDRQWKAVECSMVRFVADAVAG